MCPVKAHCIVQHLPAPFCPLLLQMTADAMLHSYSVQDAPLRSELAISAHQLSTSLFIYIFSTTLTIFR